MHTVVNLLMAHSFPLQPTAHYNMTDAEENLKAVLLSINIHI